MHGLVALLRWAWGVVLVVHLLHLGWLAMILVIVPNYAQAKRDRAILEIRSIEGALRIYRSKTNRLPSTAEGLAHLVASNHLEQLPMDPWGRPYQYNNDTGAPEIFSLGRDGMLGGDGPDADISSWDLAKMSGDPPRDWRERWQPFAIALGFVVGFAVLSGLIVVAMESIRLRWR